MVRPERFELPTLCFEGRCSIQLSYERTAQLSNTITQIVVLAFVLEGIC